MAEGSVAAVSEGPLVVHPAVVESKEQDSAAQGVGAGTLQATATAVAERTVEGPTSRDCTPGEVQLNPAVPFSSSECWLQTTRHSGRGEVHTECMALTLRTVDSESGEFHSLTHSVCCVCPAVVSSEDVLVHR